jgi:hypothetical protein
LRVLTVVPRQKTALLHIYAALAHHCPWGHFQQRIVLMTDFPLIHPVILCGGSGTRLWPLSRQSYPKQFAKLMGAESLFQASVRRMSGGGFAAPLVITGEPFRFIVAEQLAAIEAGASATLIEPVGRNTAPRDPGRSTVAGGDRS